MVNMKKDREVSLGCAIAYGTWGVAGVLFIGVMITGDVRVLAGGFLAMGIAATATVRTYFVAYSTMVRNAFELDREVTPLRR